MFQTILKTGVALIGSLIGKTGSIAHATVQGSISAVGGRRVFVSILAMAFVVWAHYANVSSTLIIAALSVGGIFNIGESIRDVAAVKK